MRIWIPHTQWSQNRNRIGHEHNVHEKKQQKIKKERIFSDAEKTNENDFTSAIRVKYSKEVLLKYTSKLTVEL